MDLQAERERHAIRGIEQTAREAVGNALQQAWIELSCFAGAPLRVPTPLHRLQGSPAFPSGTDVRPPAIRPARYARELSI